MPASLKTYLVAVRPWSFTMTLISLSLGSLAATAQGGIFSWGWFALALFTACLFHGAANILNDYFDTKSRVDQLDSATVRYRPHPVLGGLLTYRQLLIEIAFLLTLVAVLGGLMAYYRSPWLWVIGLSGFIIAMCYTGGIWPLKYNALGEVAVFLAFGPLMVVGAAFVQWPCFSWLALLLSIPHGILVATVLLANNLRDIDQDARVKIKTLGLLCGPKKGFYLLICLICGVYLFCLTLIVVGLTSPWLALILVSWPQAVKLMKRFKSGYPDDADAQMAKVNLALGLLLILGTGLSMAIR